MTRSSGVRVFFTGALLALALAGGVWAAGTEEDKKKLAQCGKEL